jgi:uncharacterized protein YceK
LRKLRHWYLMKFVTNSFIAIVLIFSLSGCGSIYTLTADPSEFEASEEDCWFIPRVYSGAVFDFHGMFIPDGGQGAAIMFWDFFLSLPVDTIALPYTVYGQIRYGSLSNCSNSKQNSNHRSP